MQVGDVITLSKQKFLLLAKAGLVVSRTGSKYYYKQNSDKNFSRTGSIQGYLQTIKLLDIELEVPTNSCWHYFDNVNTFTIVTLPKLKLLRTRKCN